MTRPTSHAPHPARLRSQPARHQFAVSQQHALAGCCKRRGARAPQDELSGADIKAVCTEAGLLALRERRMRVMHADFKKAKEKVQFKKTQGAPQGLYL